MNRVLDFLLWAGAELVRFHTRTRSVGVFMIRAGIVLLALSLGGWFVEAAWVGRDAAGGFRVGSSEGAPAFIATTVVFVGLALLLFGAVLLGFEFRAEARRKVIVLEQRGLAVRTDAPLARAVPRRIIGSRIPAKIDTTGVVRDGRVTDAQAAFNEVMQVRRDLRLWIGDTAPEDVRVVYGGIAPVPLTFLAGALIDDMGEVILMDWERSPGRWRTLDAPDDGARFRETGLAEVPAEAPAVWLVVSQSYGADLPAVRAVAGAAPIVELRVPNPIPDTHWSDDKQKALLGQFMSTLARLEGRHVRRVNLVLAAANSVVFRFGRAYDMRTMPELVVCQYERSQNPAYPWGIRMPHHGRPDPQIAHFSAPGGVAPANLRE